jgi:outer membrane protein OmpA-like peptidoglycan-associated protein
MCQRRARSRLAPGGYAFASILLSGCLPGQTQKPNVSAIGKVGESHADLQDLVSGPSFTPLEIESINGAEEEDGGLRLGEALLFAEGSDRLKDEAFAVLDGIIAMLERKHLGKPILIEGHTDWQPRRRAVWRPGMSLEYHRARSVFMYFLEHGIPDSCMQLMSYGHSKPVDPLTAHTEPGRRANRRVVIRLAPADA